VAIKGRTETESGPVSGEDSERVPLPVRARIVVVGGGVVGTSLAYHLAQFGETDVLLVEKDLISSGSTWHAAGLTGAIRSTPALTRIASRSRELYRRLESVDDLRCGYVQCGALWIARTQRRIHAMEASAQIANGVGVEARLIDPQEALELWPLLNPEVVAGAMWIPDEGRINPSDLAQVLARMARRQGVAIRERVSVSDVEVLRERSFQIKTTAGDVECEIVINAAGQWAPTIASMVGDVVPLFPVANAYVVTARDERIPASLPNLRDPDTSIYYKSETNAFVFGGVTRETALPWVRPAEIPDDFAFQLLPENWDEMVPLLESGTELTPILAELGLQKLYNGPESFTPDHKPIVAESCRAPGFFTAAGMNGSGIGLGGGMGEAVAAMVLGIDSEVDLSELHPRRFGPEQASEDWVRAEVERSVLGHFEAPVGDEDHLPHSSSPWE
jgi:4-methylaminobutanoate oxidase (formaldehyde-forming)